MTCHKYNSQGSVIIFKSFRTSHNGASAFFTLERLLRVLAAANQVSISKYFKARLISFVSKKRNINI